MEAQRLKNQNKERRSKTPPTDHDRQSIFFQSRQSFAQFSGYRLMFDESKAALFQIAMESHPILWNMLKESPQQNKTNMLLKESEPISSADFTVFHHIKTFFEVSTLKSNSLFAHPSL